MGRFLSLLLLFAAAPALADHVVAAHTIRADAILTASDIVVKPGDVPGGTMPDQLIGMEARVVLYAGRPIRLSDVGVAAVVTRNQIVPLIYLSGGLRISTDGRSLSRAGPGDRVKVMNLSSRTTVTGRVTEEGLVIVSQ